MVARKEGMEIDGWSSGATLYELQAKHPTRSVDTQQVQAQARLAAAGPAGCQDGTFLDE